MSYEQAKVGIIDVGSNSIKLLIAKRGQNSEVKFGNFVSEEVRLGEGITGTPPVIDEKAIRKGTAAIARLVERAENHRVNAIAVIATSAAREASNKSEFADAVKRACGHELRILSGEEEAKLIGRGILCDPALSNLRDFTLIDLGGGSMERIVFKNRKATHAISVELGAVRLSNLFVENRELPLPKEEQKSIKAHVIQTLISNSITSSDSESNVAVLTGGSSSLIAKKLDRKKTGVVSLSKLAEYQKKIAIADKVKRITKFSVPKARADIMPTAAIILTSVLETLHCQEIRFSKFNLRFGIAHTLLIDEIID